MNKKTTQSAAGTAVKTEDALLNEVKDPIEAAIENAEEKKPRFPRLKKYNEKRKIEHVISYLIKKLCQSVLRDS